MQAGNETTKPDASSGFTRGRKPLGANDPRLSRSYFLTFVGDWGGANLHKICCWLTEEFCRRAGPKTRTAIWSIADDDPVMLVQNGVADLCLTTPIMLTNSQVAGEGLFAGRAAPNIRGLAVIPQNDSLVLAVAPELEIRTFEELRAKCPALRIATSPINSAIGYVGRLLLEAHGIDEQTLTSWGGSFVEDEHPFDSLDRAVTGKADAVLTEAIMTPGWVRFIEERKAVPLPVEDAALAQLVREHGFRENQIPAGFWNTLTEPLKTLDFSDFLIVVRDDMPEEVAHLLAWCAVESRTEFERQFLSMPVNRSPVTYPLDPKKMAQTAIAMHPGAQRYYQEAGILMPSALLK